MRSCAARVSRRGWPMTPYRDGAQAVVTSTLAFLDKTALVRRDGRVALLAGGWLLQGTAAVHADVSGDEFVRRFLSVERRKYPPVEAILAVPLHRWLFDWYFGRVFMEITPQRVREQPGADAAGLITLDADGLPLITPIAMPDLAAADWPLTPWCAGATGSLALGVWVAAVCDAEKTVNPQGSRLTNSPVSKSSRR